MSRQLKVNTMKVKFFTLALLTFFASNVIAEEIKIPAEKTVIQFDTRMGVITFAHQKHADLSITQCTTCHHTYKPTDTSLKPCHECHLHKKSDVLKVMKALHTRCIGCHEYTTAAGQHAGPLKRKCKLCHIKKNKQEK